MTPFFITTAISYLNGRPHLGHAYEILSADAFARFKRLDGHDVFFLTGTDEHGQKVASSAEKENCAPQVFCDQAVIPFQDMVRQLEITSNDFIRTTEPRHRRAVQHLWRLLRRSGDIYLDTYKGWYSVKNEMFVPETSLSEDQEGHKITSEGERVTWVEEESFFFRLSAYQDKLLAFYQEHPDFVVPSTRFNEVKSFVEKGLQDLSVSRSTITWGLPVPEHESHTIYVWLDALTNYLSALGYPEKEAPLFRRFWPAQAHIIGKDVVRFHAVFWPAFLMSAGLPLPRQIVGHGFVNLRGEKMSKSTGNVVTLPSLLQEITADHIRYFLLKNTPYGEDGAFSREALYRVCDADLSNAFGNLVHRVFSMFERLCGGVITPVTLAQDDHALLDAAKGTLPLLRRHMEAFAPHEALKALWQLVKTANIYVDTQAPWSLAKSNPDRMEAVLVTLVDTLRMLALYAQPFIPHAADTLLAHMKVTDTRFAESCPLPPGHTIKALPPLFPRLETSRAH